MMTIQYIHVSLYVMQCELYHWIDVLNRFDEILEAAAVQQGDSAMQDETTPPQTECIFLCPQLDNPVVNLYYIIVILFLCDNLVELISDVPKYPRVFSVMLVLCTLCIYCAYHACMLGSISHYIIITQCMLTVAHRSKIRC